MKNTAKILLSVLLLFVNKTGYCESGMAYNETVDLIKNILPTISSNIRKENYNYIKFDGCLFNYSVSGVYPIGAPYTIKYSNIDFSSFNRHGSKTGADYSDFIILDFDAPFISKTDTNEMSCRTVVIDAASHEQAQTLFNAFLHLGELCRTGKPPIITER